MLSPETLLLYLLTVILLGMVPGPDNLYVASQSLRFGARSGIAITLGLCTGLLLHTLAAVAGLSLLIVEFPTLFQLVRFLGALYLLYIAWEMIRERPKWRTTVSGSEGLAMGRLYRRGIVMNLSNPKVVLFFVALLPQFAGVGSTPAILLLLGFLFIVVTLLLFGGIALLAERIAEWLGVGDGVGRYLSLASAVLIAAVALRLLFE